MKKLLRGCLLLFMLALTACGRANIFTPTPRPTATPLAILQQATDIARATAAAATTEEAGAAESAGDATTALGDPARGQELFNTIQQAAGFACVTCHNPTAEIRVVGPGLKGLKDRAGTRVEGQDAVTYLHNSIVNPNAFIVPGDPAYPSNLMPQIYSQIFSEEQINDIIAYLLTL